MVKNLAASVGDIRDGGLTPGSGRPSGEGNGNPLQYSPENSMDRRAWWVTVHAVTESDTVSDSTHSAGSALCASFSLVVVSGG